MKSIGALVCVPLLPMLVLNIEAASAALTLRSVLSQQLPLTPAKLVLVDLVQAVS